MIDVANQIIKLNSIILYSLFAFFLAIFFYPFYIKLLSYIKAWQSLRENGISWTAAKIFQKLHWHKAWTPTMGWAVFLIITAFLVLLSLIFQNLGIINNSLISRSETFIILFAFFSMWILWLIDDILNIKWIWKVKWLTAKMKLVWMFLFSAFISYWFYFKLGADTINIWPINALLNFIFDFNIPSELVIWFLFFVLTFIFTVAIVNAVNIADGLDGLAWWLSLLVLFVLAVATFFNWWYLATTILAIVIGVLAAFMWFNIYPAKIFMGDSGALALGGLIVTVVYLLNFKMGILIPFLILFWLFWIELLSSFIQIIWKKFFRKKIFAIAPFHHRLEYKGMKEPTIVMKLWLIQAVLALIALIMIFYQLG